jgi:hypothetical protein
MHREFAYCVDVTTGTPIKISLPYDHFLEKTKSSSLSLLEYNF